MYIADLLINIEHLTKDDLQKIFEITYKTGAMSITTFPNKESLENYIKSLEEIRCI